MIAHRTPSSTLARTAGLVVLTLTVAAGPASAQERPTPARLVPAAGLVALVEYDGIAGPAAAAWRGTAAHAILNDTPSGETMASVARQIADRLLKEIPGGELRSADVARIADHLMQRGFLLAIYADDKSVAIVPGLGAKEVRPSFEALLAADPDLRLPIRTDLRGRSLFQLARKPPAPDDPEGRQKTPNTISWWYEGDDFIVSDGLPRDPGAAPAPAAADGAVDLIAAVMDAIEGKAPTAASHPGRLAALAEGRAVAGFVPNGLLFIETTAEAYKVADRALANLPISRSAELGKPGEAAKPGLDRDEIAALRASGLDGVRRIVGRWGFRGRALMTMVRFEAPAPRRGLVALLDQPRLDRDPLPPIPRGTAGFAVGTLDPIPALDSFLATITATEPDSAQELADLRAAIETACREATGVRLREDLLAHLGPTWGVATTRLALGGAKPTLSPTVLVAIRDRAALAQALDTAVARLNATLRGGQPDPALVFEPLPAPERGYRLVSPDGSVPWAGPSLQPTILLGESWLIVAANPELARAARDAETRPDARWAPAGEVAATLAVVPPGLSSLSVGGGDSPWAARLAALPLAAQFLTNMLGIAEAPAGPAPQPSLLGLLGVPAPGAFRIRIDPAKIPTADQIRPHLFPSVLATVVDDRGLLFLGTEALPLGSIGGEASITYDSDGKTKFHLEKILPR